MFNCSLKCNAESNFPWWRRWNIGRDDFATPSSSPTHPPNPLQADTSARPDRSCNKVLVALSLPERPCRTSRQMFARAANMQCVLHSSLPSLPCMAWWIDGVGGRVIGGGEGGYAACGGCCRGEWGVGCWMCKFITNVEVCSFYVECEVSVMLNVKFLFMLDVEDVWCWMWRFFKAQSSIFYAENV